MIEVVEYDRRQIFWCRMMGLLETAQIVHGKNYEMWILKNLK